MPPKNVDPENSPERQTTLIGQMASHLGGGAVRRTDGRWKRQKDEDYVRYAARFVDTAPPSTL